MKVVGVIPVGREKYLRCLVPYLLRDRHLFDHIQLWVNCADEDRDYVYQLAIDHPGLFILKNAPHGENPNDRDHRVANIHYFHRNCVDPDTVYVRFDDDIVWVAPNAISDLIAYRLANPDWWMVVGNIVNNGATYILHAGGTIPPNWDSEFKQKLHLYSEMANFSHRRFFERLDSETLHKYNFEVWNGGLGTLIPNQVYAFFGKDWAKFQGETGSIDEYSWLGQTKPVQEGRRNCMLGSTLFVHYAYKPQEEGVKPDYLERYQRLADAC